MTGLSLSNTLAWTLLHSLWEGAGIALALAIALSVMRSSRARYAAACVSLVALLVAFALTAVWEAPAFFGGNFVTAQVAGVRSHGQSVFPFVREFGSANLPPWLAALWVAGVALFHVRSAAGWAAARRLRRRGVCAALQPWRDRLEELCGEFGVTKPVDLLEPCLAPVPVVIGYLRPVILFPLGLLTSLPVGQIEAILLHELAHIRRHDYLVNLLQTFIENFLFYHPAAWWISSVIRAEREHCCDDLVIATRGQPGDYAAALTALEHNRWTATNAVLAANGGNLMRRVTRILYPREHRQAALAPVFLAGVLTLIAAVALSAWQAKPVAMPADAYGKWLSEDVVYIIDARERNAFLALGTDAEREHFIEQFWLRRNPVEGSTRNEMKQEHYRRIAYANQRFATPTIAAGWQTDRGRIYISFGPPDELESHASGGAVTAPYEDWLYRKINGVGERVIMRFVDKTGTGEYQLVPS